MLLQEQIRAEGKLTVTHFDSEGNIKNSFDVKNLVVTVGKQYIASRMTGVASTVMSHMAIGSGTVAAVVGNTTLGNELGRVTLTSFTTSTNVVTGTATFPAATGTGAVTEAAILNASSSGTMLCRTVFAVVNKGAGDSIAISWTITLT